MNNCCKNILKDIYWMMEIRISLYKSFGHNKQASILESMLNAIKSDFAKALKEDSNK